MVEILREQAGFCSGVWEIMWTLGWCWQVSVMVVVFHAQIGRGRLHATAGKSISVSLMEVEDVGEHGGFSRTPG